MTERRFLVASVIAIAAAILLVLVIHTRFEGEVDDIPIGAWSIFFGLNGFFFAVLIALLIAELLRRFHRLTAVVRLEATALGQLKRALMFQEGSDAIEAAIRTDVRGYAQAVLDVEWPEMAAKRRVRAEEGAMPQLTVLLYRIRELEQEGEMDVIARRMLIDGILDALGPRFLVDSQHDRPSSAAGQNPVV